MFSTIMNNGVREITVLLIELRSASNFREEAPKITCARSHHIIKDAGLACRRVYELPGPSGHGNTFHHVINSSSDSSERSEKTLIQDDENKSDKDYIVQNDIIFHSDISSAECM